MLIISILTAILIGYIIGFYQEHTKRKKKERECELKKQMIENRDKLINQQQDKISYLQRNIKAYEEIKEIYRNERKIVDRDDKVKELIEKDND